MDCIYSDKFIRIILLCLFWKFHQSCIRLLSINMVDYKTHFGSTTLLIGCPVTTLISKYCTISQSFKCKWRRQRLTQSPEVMLS